ncbi:hypothetical protein [Nocardia brevicatena]|uniref:hypothetical protein n=1 Tax=Nocardia brevicatena TaxID=37327 RepID=UPI001C3F2804|nr:hypothetical protein [Nocardia brevicatena]
MVNGHVALSVLQWVSWDDARSAQCGVKQRWVGNPDAGFSTRREITNRSAPLIAPADVGTDRGILLGVASMVGAVQREVPQRSELALDRGCCMMR